MRRDSLSGILFVLVGDFDSKFVDEFSDLPVSKVLIDTDCEPVSDLVCRNKFRFLNPEFFRKKWFCGDYLFKWDDDVFGCSFGIRKPDVWNCLMRGEHLVVGLSLDVVAGFVRCRQIPAKNYVLVNVSGLSDFCSGIDEYSFDFSSSDVSEVKKFILRIL